ncbi:DNRLRE domain-containing protein [Streptacidiphilus pinicola]|nr:DNRLRE domain-containing protein [Streptacidiphilus pinicola]
MRATSRTNKADGFEAEVDEPNGGALPRGRYAAMVAGLSWWQAGLVLVPLALIPLGGAIGGFFGGMAAATNAALARRNQFGSAITALAMSTVALFAYGLYFIIAGSLLSWFTSGSHPSASPGGSVLATTAPAPAPYRSPPPEQQWKPVPPGVVVDQPSVINATGAALAWPAYVNTTGSAAYDVARYEVYRNGLNQDLSQSPGHLIGVVNGDQTSFLDSGAPTRTGPHDGLYTYLIGVRTKGGRFIQGTPLLVQLPMPGRTEVALPALVADTIGSGMPNSAADAVIKKDSTPHLELGPDEDMGLGNTRLVFGFGPLAMLPKGADVVEAHLSLWRSSGGNYPDQDTLYALHRSFTGAQVTWNRAAAGRPWSRPGGDYGAPTGHLAQEVGGAFDRTDFDATGAVRGWVGDPASEHGLLLKADVESVRTAPLLGGWYVPVGGAPPTNPVTEAPELFITYAGTMQPVTASASPSP